MCIKTRTFEAVSHGMEFIALYLSFQHIIWSIVVAQGNQHAADLHLRKQLGVFYMRLSIIKNHHSSFCKLVFLFPLGPEDVVEAVSVKRNTGKI